MYFWVLISHRVRWRGLRPWPWILPWGRRARDSRGASQYFSIPNTWCLASDNQQGQTVEEVQEFHPHGREVLGFQGDEEAGSSIGDNWRRRVWWSPCESWCWKREMWGRCFQQPLKQRGSMETSPRELWYHVNVFNRTTTNYRGEYFFYILPFTKYIRIERINNLW